MESLLNILVNPRKFGEKPRLIIVALADMRLRIKIKIEF